MAPVLPPQDPAKTLIPLVITNDEQKFSLKRLTTDRPPHPLTNLLVFEKVTRPTHPLILLVATFILWLAMASAPVLPLMVMRTARLFSLFPTLLTDESAPSPRAVLIVPETSLCRKTLRLEQRNPPTMGKTPLAAILTPLPPTAPHPVAPRPTLLDYLLINCALLFAPR